SNPNETSNAAVLDDVSAFANFARFLAPPPPGSVVLNGQQVPASTIAAGAAVFNSIGCATCHNPNLGPTQQSNLVPALSNVTFHPYTDMEIHHMGSGFADNVSQGNAGGDQFRTAPLWGLGQRVFFDHDGRDQSVPAAIQNHMSPGSEANTVITNYNNLNPTQKQELIDFLRSL
ncbi:MAG: di-heme oxidoredictase family protein, partial [Terracidiphilus sp.]